MKLHRISFVLAASLGVAPIWADAPAGYYNSCEGKTGKALLQQLENVIGGHTTVSYKSLYDVYKTSDVHPDGSLWDMYSTKNWGKNFTKCGNYSVVGDCVNKEHSFPKSWFDDRSPMMSDAYHIYPTDGKVNGQRSNFPYGECANGTYLPSNGDVRPLGRLGTSTFPGYSGKVFEPDNQYKGDFARSYFYMAACYNSRIATWDSPMLAGNNYPCFSSWAINLLLKWHREDPVSDKETVRNDAVERHQHNRNPFIDHPELAEYIWGDKVGQPWSATLAADPQFTLPVNGSAVSLPLTAVNVTSSVQVTVQGVNLDENVAVSVSGNGFSASSYSLPYSEVNGKGVQLTVNYNSATAGKAAGKLTLSSGGVSVSVDLSAEAVDGLPVLGATLVSWDAFTANWVNISGPSAKYTLDVRRDGASIDGYPRQVDAAEGKYRVEGLEPETTYTYTVSDGTLTSEIVTVTTSAPVPSVTFLYDGELSFSAKPGEPSDVAEILVEIDNISGDVTLSVTAPFQLSLNKQEWSSSVVIAPGADRFYMRLYSVNEGDFTTSLTATAEGGFFYDDVTVDGKVTPVGASFVEDFEKQIPEGGSHGYGPLTYEGNACTWATSQVYFEYAGSNSYPHTGEQAVRFNAANKGDRYIMMLQDKPNGMGTLRFWARPWREDKDDCVMAVSVSADQGATWTLAGDMTVTAKGSANEYAEYSLPINRSGNLRLKIEQITGNRCMLDDLSVSDYGNSGLLTPEGHAYHSWDAYSVAGTLVIENSDPGNYFYIYSIDGREVFAGTVGTGNREMALPAGLYIVNVSDFSRRVLVK